MEIQLCMRHILRRCGDVNNRRQRRCGRTIREPREGVALLVEDDDEAVGGCALLQRTNRAWGRNQGSSGAAATLGSRFELERRGKGYGERYERRKRWTEGIWEPGRQGEGSG